MILFDRGPTVLCAAAVVALSAMTSCSPRPPSSRSYVEIAADDDHACGRTAKGFVWCWGRNGAGQLGVRPRRRFLSVLAHPQPRPVKVGGLVGATQLALGLSSSCALISDGTVRCWGSGVCDDGDQNTCFTPTPVAGLTDVVQISGGSMGCAVHRTGKVSCFVINGGGSQLVQVPDLESVVEVAVSEGSQCARLVDGGVRCWGTTDFGRLGDGTSTSADGSPDYFAKRDTPTRVVGLPPATGIAVGSNTSCAVSDDGLVRCWGKNERGSLGNGQFSGEQAVPAPVPGVSGAVEVAVGGHGCARSSDGTVRCWGWGGFGQLGNGSQEIDWSPPVTATGLTTARQLALGGTFSCARTDDGVFCWGSNNYGQLGDGSTLDRYEPTRMPW